MLCLALLTAILFTSAYISNDSYILLVVLVINEMNTAVRYLLRCRTADDDYISERRDHETKPRLANCVRSEARSACMLTTVLV